jgi:hypothetical protein
VPLVFEDDGGGRAFIARASGYAVRVGPQGAEIALRRSSSAPPQLLTMRFIGADGAGRGVDAERAPGTVSYFNGSDPSQWRTDVPTFSRVRFNGIYPGVDVAYYGTDREIEYDLILAPGADPSAITMAFEGATALRVSADGGLAIEAGSDTLTLRPPVAHQDGPQGRTPVSSRYEIADATTARIIVGAYDATRTLVIDPILSYSALVGGQALDEASAVAIDASGNVYLAGTTASTNFPGATGAAGGLDVFVAKLDRRGTSVLFAAYVGGSALDEARAVAIDPEGNMYVGGLTTSDNFPTRVPRQAARAGDSDGFLFKISTTGAGLVYSTYHGGPDFDEVNAVAVDAARYAYIGGTTRSASFPVQNARQGAHAGYLDGFVARYNPTGALSYSTFHGGSGTDTITALAVDPSGNATVTGSTTSTDLPLSSPVRSVNAGRVDAYVSRFTAAGTFIYSTYYGGEGADTGQGVAVAANGWSYVAGSTTSALFPTLNPIQAAPGGSLDAFLLAVGPGGVVTWATYYGGARSERGRALAIDAAGRLVMAGQTMSANLPVLRAAQPASGGNRDGFVVQLDPPHAAITYSTYLGGSNNDEAVSVAIDAVGRVFVAGSSSYPVPSIFQGVSDAFVYGLSSGTDGVDSDGDGMSDTWETQYGLDPTRNDAAEDPDGDGVSNLQELAANTHPLGLFTRYLAEGATGTFFDDRIALFNPGAALATVLLRFQREGSPELQRLLAVPAHSRLTVNPETITGLEATSFSTAIESDQSVVVDRTMTWDGTGFGSHAETSIEQASNTWYLAEGATGGTFDLYYLLQNPNASAAQVRITYLRPAGAPLVKTYTVNARSRLTINVDNERFAPSNATLLSATDVSAQIESTNGMPILVERAMYMTSQGRLFAAGHNSAGITTPATNWFLAEGATGTYFDLFILLANPTTTPTLVEIAYLLTGGQTITRQYALAAQSRRTVYVDAEPGLADVATSAVVRSLDVSVPIVVERAMWWPGGNWTEAHNSAGALVTSPRWALAEGEFGGSRANQTYILLANTSAFAGDVRVTLYFEDQGAPFVNTYTVPPRSRYNVDLANTAAQGRRFSALVEGLGATPPQLVVERAMYSNAGTAVWAAGTNALATPLFPPNTLTVTPNGIFPKVLVVDEGARVTIVNQDPDAGPTDDCSAGGHDISDDPHPTHGDNPEFGIGRLDFGQSRQTSNLTTTGSFGVHDHCHGADSKWWARVVVRPLP